jgi:DNA-binding transcriptional ArsR family regulator
MAKRMMREREPKAADRILAAFSDANRRAMMQKLIERPRSVNEIADGLPISRPAVSQHLKILAAAELVIQKKDGNRRIYSANPVVLGELRAYVDALWEASLSNFASSIVNRKRDR